MTESPMQAIEGATETLDRYRDAPAGRVGINVLEDAVGLLLEPVMPLFVDRYPEVEIDISVSNRLIDVVGSGFDAGIRYGGTVPEDMIAQRLTPDVRWITAASPIYLERFGTPPTHGICATTAASAYVWETASGINGSSSETARRFPSQRPARLRWTRAMPPWLLA